VIPSFVTGKPKPNPWGGPQSLTPAPVAQGSRDPLLQTLTEDGFIEREAARGPNGMELTAKDQQRIHELMFELGARDALAIAVESEEYRAAKLAPPPPNNGTPEHVKLLNTAISRIRKDAYERYASEDSNYAVRYGDWKRAQEASRGDGSGRDMLQRIERELQLLK
jgi:DNA-binding PadR family transcriptional regulator